MNKPNLTVVKTHWRWWRNPPPEEVMQDRETLLKYELSLIQMAYMEECEPITKEIAKIESMKPIRQFIIPSKRSAEWEAAQVMAMQQGGFVRTWFDGAEMRAEHVPMPMIQKSVDEYGNIEAKKSHADIDKGMGKEPQSD